MPKKEAPKTMEEKMDEILELPAHHKSVVALTLGHRTEEPRHPKVRMEVVM